MTDIVIYGATSAGIIAGIQARAMGKSVVVIEPSGRVGGLTTGGLGQTDIGNKQVIGGLSRRFYERIAAHYAGPEAWTWQRRDEYRDSGQTRTAEGETSMWTFEPSAALRVYHDWIAETGLHIVYRERLDRERGVKMDGARMVSITMESGRVFAGGMFIDATYEGDLMATAGVDYTVGREANAKYGETLNGVQARRATSHNLVPGIDPFRIPGNPASGLLPFIDRTGPGEEGTGDCRVQAYCFRMCLTDHPENRIPFHKPDGYDESWFELLLRNFEAGEHELPWINSSMPNRKTDTNNKTGFSTDFIGQNHAYPEASYAGRERIVARHRLYQQGLMWTLANQPRVPGHIRREVARWGMCRDEFVEGGGWQEQLYIREARRMVGDFIMTEHHCWQHEPVADSIGMGAYTMDSHNTQRYVDANVHVRNEGNIEVGGFPPYPISYRSITPRRSEARNLLVPVCLSASHIAFGSIRMEPVFMVLGQSAATAAVLALDGDTPVQDVSYAALKQRLLADHQRLY
ncbi:MAG TPA: FAD-dependent oxidoreductase [Kiritimatiellia bacterium]|nr:FAD-dependent oxidoreductase [Kiritimatiellia bacterium]